MINEKKKKNEERAHKSEFYRTHTTFTSLKESPYEAAYHRNNKLFREPIPQVSSKS